MNIEILKQAGIDYDKGVARFMGDSELYETVLEVFLQDDTFAKAEAAFDAQDYKQLFECAHSLKGTSGNMDMTKLYQIACVLTDSLRNSDQIDEEKVIELFMDLKNTYQQIQEGIIAAKGV